eukprot:925209-Pelagomonas_calceolata.AAC.2
MGPEWVNVTVAELMKQKGRAERRMSACTAVLSQACKPCICHRVGVAVQQLALAQVHPGRAAPAGVDDCGG